MTHQRRIGVRRNIPQSRESLFMFALKEQHFSHTETGQVITGIGGQRFFQFGQSFVVPAGIRQEVRVGEKRL